ncbi:MAG: FtsX-like permease family protein [Treponema sp.]|nr:FtsX-like permease family protein [Treponema sp.]
MEKFFTLFTLGINYLYRYRRRYGFLLAALVFCFAVVTFITSSRDRMIHNVYYSAQQHYAGDLVAVANNKEISVTNHFSADNIVTVLNAADKSGIKARYTVLRTFLGDKGTVYFNGNAIMQKYVIGCDWENEEHLFSKMNFTSPVNYPIGDDGIILSAPVADDLGAKIGDSVVLETENRFSQKNTGQFIIKGIVKDTSLFGYYKVYISRLSLNRLLLFNDDDCSFIGFFFSNPSSAEKNRIKLQPVLEEVIQTGPLVYSRDEMEREKEKAFSGTRVFLYTMSVYLSEISDLLEALQIITYALYGMMLLIIFVSAAVTYRLILHERTREMGVMRAIGFFGNDLRIVLWTEIIILGFISLAAGFLLSIILSAAASFMSFAWFPGFEIFLNNGKLTALYLPGSVIINIVLTLLILVAAAIVPSIKASTKNLPSLLSGEPI